MCFKTNLFIVLLKQFVPIITLSVVLECSRFRCFFLSYSSNLFKPFDSAIH